MGYSYLGKGIDAVAGGGDIEVEDEGISLTTAVTKFNFAGTGVTVTDPVADEVLVTIPGGGGSPITVQDEGTPLTVDVGLFNFAGGGVTVTEPITDEVLVTIPSETSHADVVVDGDFTSQGIMLRGATSGTYSITADNTANWDVAYTHSQDPHAPSNADNTALNETSHADVVQDGDFISQGIMLRGVSSGTYSITADNTTNWDTAYTHSQATHAPTDADNTAANETSHADVVQDGDFASNGYMKRTAAGVYGIQSSPIPVTETDAKCTDATADNTSANETSHSDVLVDSEFASAGLMKTDGAGLYSIDSAVYITASAVTYGNLNTNGDVGTGAAQVAQGDHSHTWLSLSDTDPATYV